jgi:Ca-activated chloride channel family protein
VPLDIAIVADLSLSMNASDIRPTRIERARDVVIQVSQQVPRGRLSLIVFGDWPYTLVPPTEDPGVVAYFAESLTGALVSKLASSIRTRSGDQGASLQEALVQARTALDSRPTAGARRVILLVSDGAVSGSAEDVRNWAAAGKDAAVWTAGIGKTNGAKLEGRSVVGARGDLPTAGFDARLLRSVAIAGGGVYEDVSDDRGLRALVSRLRQLSGASGPANVGPERTAFWLGVLAMALLLWEGGLDAGKRVVFGGSNEEMV